VPNRGRDIGPFLSTCAGGALDGYELVGHLHTKKSVDVDDANLGASWYRFLLANLVGGREGGAMLDRIATRALAADGPGMVFPEDPYAFDDEGNMAGVAALAQRAGWPQPPTSYRFPVGSMFWARPEALRPLLALGLAVEDYPCEPLPYDGTILHALERALGLAGAAAPGGLAVTNIQGVTR
jgi:lipopolysaccharide biosynthesis protein